MSIKRMSVKNGEHPNCHPLFQNINTKHTVT